jgi:hypothetical protein
LHDLINDPGAKFPKTRISPVDTYGPDDVITLLSLPHQSRNHLWRVLQIRIEGNNDVTPGARKASEDRAVLAVVAIQEDADDFVPITLRRLADKFRGGVTTPIINKDKLKTKSHASAGLETASKKLR